MAREQRKDVDYFPHDCTHGRKMHVIETRYGNDGYAVWFKLLEQLGKANNHYIDISDEMTLMFLTSVFKVDEETTLNILGDLAKIQAIDKELFDEHKILWSDKFCNSIEDAYRKRKQKMFSKEDILNLKLGKNISIPSGNPSIPRGLTEKSTKNSIKEVNQAESIPKEEYSIVKESREEDILEEKKSKNEIFASELLQSEQWIETLSMQNKITPAEIPKWLDDFKYKLISELDNKISKKEFASHFSRWLPGEILKNKKPTQNGTSNPNYEKKQFRFSTSEALKAISGNSE